MKRHEKSVEGEDHAPFQGGNPADARKTASSETKAESKGTNGMSGKRMQKLLVNALCWADEASGDLTRDLIRGMGIKPKELVELGFDKEDYSEMFRRTGRRKK